MELLLKETIQTARRCGFVKKAELGWESDSGYNSSGQKHRVSNRQWTVLQGPDKVGSFIKEGGDKIKTDIQEESKGEAGKEESFGGQREEMGSASGAEKAEDLFGPCYSRHGKKDRIFRDKERAG